MIEYRITFYGKKILLANISHSHLSNILWFFELADGLDGQSLEIKMELEKRFGGIRLPYYPMVSYTAEIDTLRSKGYLYPIKGSENEDIIVNGKWVGQVRYN